MKAGGLKNVTFDGSSWPIAGLKLGDEVTIPGLDYDKDGVELLDCIALDGTKREAATPIVFIVAENGLVVNQSKKPEN
jgi:hypothetical protein